MAGIRFHIILWMAFVLGVSNTLVAQPDSIVFQNWKRDPNSDIENTVSNQKQIITKEQILYSGYTLVSDVLQLIDGWTISTWNGDRWNQQNGAGNYQSQNWTLLLNGQRIELMKLDAQHINTLGIAVWDIERIEVVNAVGNYLGEFNDKGIIHIITKQNKEGLTYRGVISDGNEIGDPHLNVMDNLGLNVHQYGTVLSNHLGYKTKKWNIQANQLLYNYFYRDTTPIIFDLIRKYNPNAPFSNTLLSGNILVSYTSAKVTHQLNGIITRADDVITPAGIFNPVTGQNNYNYAGYTMRYVTAKGVLLYKGGLQQRTFTGYDQKQLSHEQLYLTHNLNYTTRLSSRKGYNIKQYGLAYDYVQTRLTDSLTGNSSAHLIRPYFSLTYPLTKKSNVFTDLSVATNTKTVVPKLALGYYKQPSIITNWSFVTSFSQRVVAENNSYFSMLPLIDSGSVYLSDEVSGAATLDYYFNLNINKYFKVSFNSGLKYLNNELFFEPVTLNNTVSPVLSYTEIEYMQQTRWVNRLNIHYDMLKNTRFDVNYLRTAVFNDEWSGRNNIPKHRFSFTLLQSLPARLNIWARYYYQSTSYWMNPYVVIKPGSVGQENLYSQLSSTHTFDAGVTKRLMKEYLVLNLSVRNVFNGQEQYQVNGAAFYMRLFLSVKLNIDGIFANGSTNP